jgi:hypothetical protein
MNPHIIIGYLVTSLAGRYTGKKYSPSEVGSECWICVSSKILIMRHEKFCEVGE